MFGPEATGHPIPSISARVGATSYRPEQDKSGYHESKFGRQFERRVSRIAKHHGVTIDSRKQTRGYWLGDQEPSWSLLVHDGEDGVRAFQEDVRARWNQDGVWSFAHDESGPDAEVFVPVEDDDAALAALEQAGVEGATLIPGEGIVLWLPGGTGAEAAQKTWEQLGVDAAQVSFTSGRILQANRPEQ